MVPSMNSGLEAMNENTKKLKMIVDHPSEEEYGSLRKRLKQISDTGGFVGPTNTVDEPAPLGLRLSKTQSLLDMIQNALKSGKQNIGGHIIAEKKEPKFSAEKRESKFSAEKRESKFSAASAEKLKASNFAALILKIGNWEYKSRHEGDLVAKCYFAKHKLVWEVLDAGLKNKIEIQWSDITAMKATCPEDSPGTLDLVLARPPLFFRETNPQPRKHTIWQTTSDFTNGQASICRRHYLEIPKGLLRKHFEKLIQCDPNLQYLCQQGEIRLDSPFFEPGIVVSNDQNEHGSDQFERNGEGGSSFFGLQGAFHPLLLIQPSSSMNDQDDIFQHLESYPRETPSPCSDKITGGVEHLNTFGNCNHIMAPDLHSSMSMSDLVSHLEYQMLEQGSFSNPTLSNEEWPGLQYMPDSHVPRVNSVSCLLQNDTAADVNAHYDNSVVQNNIGESINGHYVDTNYNAPQNEFDHMYGYFT